MTGARLGAGLWWGLLPLGILLWGVGALATGSLPGLPEVPLSVLVLNPVVRFAKDVALAIAVGGAITSLAYRGPRLRRWTMGWSLVAVALVAVSVLGLLLDASAGDLPLIDPEALAAATVGRATLVQFGCVTLAAAVTASPAFDRIARWPRGLAVALLLAGIAAPAWASHAGQSSEHALAGVIVGLHVAAILAWVGSLAVVCGLLVVDADAAPAIVPRFSLTALWCVMVAAESGLMAASLTSGSLGNLLGSTYGSLVIVKAVLLAWLIRLGWEQRRRAVDRISQAHAPQLIVRIAGVEFLAMGTALAASVVLARIGPPPVPVAGFAPLTLIALGLGAPMVALLVRARGWRVARQLPEASVLVLLVVLIEVGGIGLLRQAFGGIGLLLEVGLLVVTGWCASWALCGPRSGMALALGLIGLPLVMAANWWLAREFSVSALTANVFPWPMASIAAVTGSALLMAWWRAGQRRLAHAPVPAVKVAA
ncbi:MAG: CopD family protein [Actinomycetales bacterium]|nr:CopD family protein [Actinomycetales bacterium]